jgi:uracil-DNA glycosylase family 4
MPPNGKFCDSCPHSAHGQRFIGPDGSGSSGVMLVGDSVWKDELAAGRVFAGAAGRLLDRILSLMPGGGMQRNDLTVANSIFCAPKYLGWMDRPHPEAVTAIEHCRPNLDELIEQRRPRVIVPMGNVALRRVCGVSGIEERAGYVLPTPYGIPAVPTFHPAYLLRGKQSLVPVVLWALQRAGQIADGTYHDTAYTLLVDVPPADLKAYVASAGPRIGSLFVDIETPESSSLDEEDLDEKGPSYTIVRAGFSVRQGTACSFPWEEPYISIMRDALSRAEEVVEWADNHYDTRRLAAAGLSIPAKVVSGMWAWHWLQSDLRKGLGLVAPFFYAGPPWKHLNAAEPGRYNALDNAIGNDCYLGTRAALIAQGRWSSFERHCTDFDPVLQRMGKKGLRIDRAYQAEFMARLEAEWDIENAKVQALVPDAVRPVKMWKRPPKDMAGVEELPLLPPAQQEILAAVGDKLGALLADLHEPVPANQESLRTDDGSSLHYVESAAKLASATPYRYMRRLEFNVDSWQQIQRLAKHLGIKLPPRDTTKETDEEALATDKKTLSHYVKKYPVFKHILACRERWKLVSTYKWPLDADDRVHYTLGFHPSTWRLSCRNQNLQTIPKRSDLAHLFRRMIVATPGHKIVEGDSAAIEAVLVGYFANSTRYMRLAKSGVHGWLTSALHGQPISLDLDDATLTKLCKASKRTWPADYEKIKRVIHLSNYLGTKRRIHEEYPDDFATEKEAGKLQQFYLGSEPGLDVRAWQKATVELAHANKALENGFNLRHRFYSLYAWNARRQSWEFGDDAKRAVAFKPQSAAAAIQRIIVARLLHRLPECAPWLCLLVHDAIIADVPDEHVGRYAQTLYDVMTSPIDELEGLTIGAEVSVGDNAAPFAEDNLGGMQEWKTGLTATIAR